MTNIQTISAANLPKSGIIIIDVRTEAEHIEKHLAQPHVLMPLNQLDAKKFMSDNQVAEDKILYILCHRGMRAMTAAQIFIDAGFTNVQVIEGGILACEASGMEIA
jgi:rhodanese-related sulfurtransferase